MSTTAADRSITHYSNAVSLMQALQEKIDANGGQEPTCDWMLQIYDPETTVPQTPDREYDRLSVLKSYQILDTPRELEFESITQEAKEFFQVPIVVVSLVDLGRQWFKSIQGLDAVSETPRSCSFCAHVVAREDEPRCDPVLVIPDATQDARFSHNPLVQDGLKVRFYAGAPLISPEGPKLGAFCILDTKPRPQGLSVTEKLRLQDFARFAVYHMITRCS
ncbi:hypothetical protein ACA910_014123 [Epithemia clementina (nom. ined.)]